MPWFRTDDEFWRHRKVRKLGRGKTTVPALVACVGLWQLAGSWAADNVEHTDGFVPWDVIEDWDAKRTLAGRLLAVGLWEEAEHDGEKGIRYHDWPDYNPTAAQVADERAAAADRMRRIRASRAQSRRSSPERSGEHTPEQLPERSGEQQANNGANVRSSFAVGSAPPYPYPTVPTEQSTRVTRADTHVHARDAGNDDFDRFWALYPKRVGKESARKAWSKARKTTEVDVILAGAGRYATQRQGQDAEYTAHPATWLNAGRWDDEPPAPTPAEADDFQLPAPPRDIADDPDPAVYVRWARAQRDAWITARNGRPA